MKPPLTFAIRSEYVPEPPARGNTGHKLRVLSFNIQTGINTERYSQYLTKAWKHVLPHPRRFRNLDRIAGLLREYDLVGLQEVDAGSLRSGFVNLTEYLAGRAGFPYWYDQTNRKLGSVAKHAIGVLSRQQCSEIIEHRLPGPIPGRGALSMRFGNQEASLLVMIIHLALGKRARLQQLDYIAEQVNQEKHVLVMGYEFSLGKRRNALSYRTHADERTHSRTAYLAELASAAQYRSHPGVSHSTG